MYKLVCSCRSFDCVDDFATIESRSYYSESYPPDCSAESQFLMCSLSPVNLYPIRALLDTSPDAVYPVPPNNLNSLTSRCQSLLATA